jgi:branched-chain amino acid transport system ATP-binding protein
MTPVLDIRNLHKRFGGLTATDDVSLTVMPGEIHALIGPNGAGKSTLINQICGELVPNSGRILMQGNDITTLSTPARTQRGLGRTFQITSLLDDATVLQNISMAVQARTPGNFRLWDRLQNRSLIWNEAADMLAASTIADRSNTPAQDLSHGERKQLELLVALARKPKLLLLDEPMAGLGHVESGQMIDTLRDIAKTTPMLLVEHDMDAVFALATRISVLVYGQIIASGSVEDIRANPAVRDAYLGEEETPC